MIFNSMNCLYLIFNKVNGYSEEINGNKFLTLVPNSKSKEKKLKNYEELWSKIKIKSSGKEVTDFYDKKIRTCALIIPV